MRPVRPRGERRSKCSAQHLASREKNHRAARLRERNPGGRMPVKYRRICGNSCLFGRGCAPPETASSGSRKCCRASVGRNRLGAGPLRKSPCIACVASLRGGMSTICLQRPGTRYLASSLARTSTFSLRSDALSMSWTSGATADALIRAEQEQQCPSQSRWLRAFAYGHPPNAHACMPALIMAAIEALPR